MRTPDPRWCALKDRSRGELPAPARPEPPKRGDSSRAEPERTGGGAPRLVDRADFDPAYDPAAPIVCEMCGNEMSYTSSCKILCGVCGYKRDCTDP